MVGSLRPAPPFQATANVDRATDRLIQLVVRDQFKTATVLTIAHRLSSIADSDRVMVLDAGAVVEFDTPQVLEASNGAFAALVAAQND